MVMANHIVLTETQMGVKFLFYSRRYTKQTNADMLPYDNEGIFVDLNLRKKKWLLFGLYHPPSQSNDYFFHQVKKY